MIRQRSDTELVVVVIVVVMRRRNLRAFYSEAGHVSRLDWAGIALDHLAERCNLNALRSLTVLKVGGVVRWRSYEI